MEAQCCTADHDRAGDKAMLHPSACHFCPEQAAWGQGAAIETVAAARKIGN